MAIHVHYEKLIEEDRRAVDIAFQRVADTFKAQSYDTAMDDRAERLVEAIARYMVESCDGHIEESGFIARGAA